MSAKPETAIHVIQLIQLNTVIVFHIQVLLMSAPPLNGIPLRLSMVQHKP